MAEKAIALAPNRPEGYEALGLYYRMVASDAARGSEQYAKGLALAPNDPNLLRGVGRTEAMANRWPDALERFRQAERLDPRGIGGTSSLSEMRFCAWGGRPRRGRRMSACLRWLPGT